MSSERKKPRTASTEWKWRRREAIIRDDYTCQECGVQGGPKGDADLEVHHITPVTEGGSDDLENLDTLCQSCHQRSHAEMKGNSGHFETKYPTEDFLDAIANAGGTAGTQEVADAVGCVYETAYKKLRGLEEEGLVESNKFGNARAWSVTTQNDDA